MRRRIGATALAVAALLTLTGVAGSAAHAAVSADDIFYPVDGSAGAAGDAANGGDKGGKGAGVDAVTAAGAGASATDDRETALARGDRQAANMLGYLPSLYQGRWYMPGKEDVRRCIMDRESNFNYRANGGAYFGAYQMSAALARGATYMMQSEVSKEMGAEGVAMVKALRQTTPNNWNRYWQDRAFWTIWAKGDGAGHWRGGGINCG